MVKSYINNVVYQRLHSQILAITDGTFYLLSLKESDGYSIPVDFFSYDSFVKYTMPPERLIALFMRLCRESISCDLPF